MNKTEFKKKAKALVKKQFEMFSNIKIIEMECNRSTIDNDLFINYIVIVDVWNIYRCYVSEDNFYNDSTLYYKELKCKEIEKTTALYDNETLEQIY